jgi:apolipoprotein D and lipocalin family protein
MRVKVLIGLVSTALLFGGCIGINQPPLDVVEDVDLEQYAGKWYEIARYPNWFQSADCVATTAEYTLRDDGKVDVVNRCRIETFDGPVESIEGTARVPNPEVPAKLKVSFFLFFEGDYWIIDLDEEYEWAVVGEPRREFLWILSRAPVLDDEVYEDILARLPEKGYDPGRLRLTPQPASE